VMSVVTGKRRKLQQKETTPEPPYLMAESIESEGEDSPIEDSGEEDSKDSANEVPGEKHADQF